MAHEWCFDLHGFFVCLFTVDEWNLSHENSIDFYDDDVTMPMKQETNYVILFSLLEIDLLNSIVRLKFFYSRNDVITENIIASRGGKYHKISILSWF